MLNRNQLLRWVRKAACLELDLPPGTFTAKAPVRAGRDPGPYAPADRQGRPGACPGQKTTTERSTSPRSMRWKASSTSSSGDRLAHEAVEVEPALQVEVDEHREVARRKAVAVPARLERPAPPEELDHRQVDASSSGWARRPARACRPGRGRRTPARNTSGWPTASMHDVGAVAVGERAHRLDRVASDASTVWVAPKPRANSSLRASRSTAMIVAAPASRAPRSRRRPRRRSRTRRPCRPAARRR